jgi:hypothetical protein
MKHGKIILVNPRITSPRSVRLPLSLLALGAALENRYEYFIVDGNIEPDLVTRIRAILAEHPVALLACTVMPGPQVGPAIAISSAVRHSHPAIPIIWGGYFPTLYPDSALNAIYVDYVARGQGENTLLQLLGRLPDAGPPRISDGGYVGSCTDPDAVSDIQGLSWKRDGHIVHNSDRGFVAPDSFPDLPYHRLGDITPYLRPSFLGKRTGVHQAAIGCRYRCSFCGVVSMFNGVTRFPAAERLAQTLLALRGLGADAMQYYDNNFFDREENTLPLLEVMARYPMPWWCYGRADTLANASENTWRLLEKSRLRMVYIGAEAADDAALRKMKKGTRVEQTFEVARRMRGSGFIPEFSFVLGSPDMEDPEEDIERNFLFIKRLKQIHPECEIILYFYTPTPQRNPQSVNAGARIPVMPMHGLETSHLPTTPEEWTEQRWIDFVCHQDAPWLSAGLRQRVRDFSKVLYCRYPTVQDHSTPRWGKSLLKGLAGWRYASGYYGRSWELDLARRWIRIREPQRESI